MRSQVITQHYTPHATLAAVGIKINQLQLFDTIGKHLFIKQKTVRHRPIEKLYDAAWQRQLSVGMTTHYILADKSAGLSRRLRLIT